MVEILQGQDLAPFVSEYLAAGYRQDAVAIRSVELDLRRAACTFDMSSVFTPASGVFHLTVPTAFIVVAQTAITWAHWRQGLTRKEVEVWLTRFDIECKRPVLQRTDIRLDLELSDERRLPSGHHYKGSIRLADGAFRGMASFFMPRNGEN